MPLLHGPVATHLQLDTLLKTMIYHLDYKMLVAGRLPLQVSRSMAPAPHAIVACPLQITRQLPCMARRPLVRAAAICQPTSAATKCTKFSRGQLQRVHAAGGTEQDEAQAAVEQQDWTRKATSAGLLLLWAAVLGYAFTLAPNQTPYRDMLYLQKLTGINASDGVQVNSVFFNLFNIMGIYPALYSALLLPASKSANKVPAGPFLGLSFGAGIFALLPYFALWAPLPPKEQTLPPKAELGFVRKALESRITAGVLLAASVFLLGSAVTAGQEAWIQYVHLFDESRFCNVTSIDFCLLTAFLPFWLQQDAQFRDFKYRDQAIFLAFLPLIGPALYLLLRPQSE